MDHHRIPAYARQSPYKKRIDLDQAFPETQRRMSDGEW